MPLVLTVRTPVVAPVVIFAPTAPILPEPDCNVRTGVVMVPPDRVIVPLPEAFKLTCELPVTLACNTIELLEPPVVFSKLIKLPLIA